MGVFQSLRLRCFIARKGSLSLTTIARSIDEKLKVTESAQTLLQEASALTHEYRRIKSDDLYRADDLEQRPRSTHSL
jgi:hypothetical protein